MARPCCNPIVAARSSPASNSSVGPPHTGTVAERPRVLDDPQRLPKGLERPRFRHVQEDRRGGGPAPEHAARQHAHARDALEQLIQVALGRVGGLRVAIGVVVHLLVHDRRHAVAGIDDQPGRVLTRVGDDARRRRLGTRRANRRRRRRSAEPIEKTHDAPATVAAPPEGRPTRKTVKRMNLVFNLQHLRPGVKEKTDSGPAVPTSGGSPDTGHREPGSTAKSRPKPFGRGKHSDTLPRMEAAFSPGIASADARCGRLQSGGFLDRAFLGRRPVGARTGSCMALRSSPILLSEGEGSPRPLIGEASP